MVSFLMPTYNSGQFITETLDSIIQQTYQDWELIAVDDCSTDNTLHILEEYSKQESRIKVFKLERNLGQTYALNFGLVRCRGEYIARIDNDDVCSPERIETQRRFLDSNPDYGMCGSFATIINEKSEEVGSISYLLTSNKDLQKRIKIDNQFLHSSVFIRKEILDLCGGYDTLLKYPQDYKLWIQISRISKVANIPEYLIKYRVQNTNASFRNYRAMKREMIYMKLYLSLLKNNYVKIRFTDFIKPFIPTGLLLKLWYRKVRMDNENREKHNSG